MFEFKPTGNGQQSSSSEYKEVDWKAMQEYVVKEAAAEQPETLVGVVSSIIDTGIQPQSDAEYIFEGNEQAEAEEIKKDSRVRFETRAKFYDNDNKKWVENVRLKVVPRKDVQQVAVTIDFPDIMLDKGQFFGDTSGEKKPLRLILGGEFKPSKDSPIIVAKPLALTVRKNDKTYNEWSFMPNHTFYQMAVGAKLIEKGKPFLPDNIGQLIGKAFQFEVQVGFNDKGYYFEKCSFKAALGRGQVVPQFDPSILSMVLFDVDNKEEYIKTLRASIKNTIKRAKNYQGSKIQQQLEGSQSSNNQQNVESNTNAQVSQQSAPNRAVEPPSYVTEEVPFDDGGSFDDFEDGLPF